MAREKKPKRRCMGRDSKPGKDEFGDRILIWTDCPKRPQTNGYCKKHQYFEE